MATTSGDGYGVGQACINGHQIEGDVEREPQYAEDFCSRCGARTITGCEHCAAPIHGRYRDVFVPGWDLGRFCYKCGQPYPWTAAGIAALRDLTDVAEGLSPKEREALSASFDDLVRDTPRTSVAVVRVKLALAKVGGTVGPAMREILVSVGTEAVKKQLGL